MVRLPAGVCAALFSFLMLLHGCPGQSVQLKYKATGSSPELLAVYEAWFGYPKHISVGYSSHDSEVIKTQIQKAKAMGISAFVVDWYGDRDTYIDQSYAIMQKTAAKEKFHVAMMYEESGQEDGATDEVIADFTMFHDAYLASGAPGRKAYLTYDGRPLIFIFSKGHYTDWARVRKAVDNWDSAPLLIQENAPGPNPEAFDGFYPWIHPGEGGWAADGSHWGESYLANFYKTMAEKDSDKIVIGAAWPGFDDSKASWGLHRRMSSRCGQTFSDTFNFWKKYFPPGQTIPFIMIETWNDYEEGSDIEQGLPSCPGQAPAPTTLQDQSPTAPSTQPEGSPE